MVASSSAVPSPALCQRPPNALTPDHYPMAPLGLNGGHLSNASSGMPFRGQFVNHAIQMGLPSHMSDGLEFYLSTPLFVLTCHTAVIHGAQPNLIGVTNEAFQNLNGVKKVSHPLWYQERIWEQLVVQGMQGLYIRWTRTYV
ncbi:unnamed protein product [Litomosoides sigmodontis]|uniref:Uncharacterized protein n=1 Tax=Litomosoides sigmodontis TaxID=42156 RepID=A0A3P6S7P0_LITSI|nr:unnamed protein product [Litomosoides sigmodontis]